MMSNKVKGFAAGIVAAIFYGTNPLGALSLYQDGFSSTSVLIYRYGIAALMFMVWMLIKGESFKIKWGQAIRFAVLGTFFSISSAMLYLSFHYMDAGIASTILFCYPIMTAVLMVAFYHERVTWGTTISIVLAIVGIAMLYRGGDTTLSTMGVSLVMLSSLLYSFYIIGVNQTHTGYSPVKFTFWIILFGVLAILVFALIEGEPIQMIHTPKQCFNAIQLALLPTVLSLYFMNISIDNIGSTPSSIMGALEPVTAVVIGVCVYGEEFSFRLAMGILFILSAVILLVALRRNK